MARALLKSMRNQKDSGFVHLPQHDLESLVYVLAYAVMKKERGIKPAKHKSDGKHLRMEMLYHQMFGYSTFSEIGSARSRSLWTWTDYRQVVAGDDKPSVLHNVIGALLVQADRQNVIEEKNMFLGPDDTTPSVPMDGKCMRELLKRGIAMEKAHQGDDSPDSDVGADYD
jgi:hypothetical protein